MEWGSVGFAGAGDAACEEDDGVRGGGRGDGAGWGEGWEVD